jgi:uncharacterized protein YkwD
VLIASLATVAGAATGNQSSAARDWLTRCFLSLPAISSSTEVYPSANAQEYAQSIFDQTNAVRSTKKLRALKRDAHLDAVAQAHALDMAQQGYFDHHSPQGMDVFDRMESAGCPHWWTGGENIAAGYNTPQIAVKAWMDSPGHRRNVLDGNYEYIGVGAYYAPGSEYGWYWVQVFASYDDPDGGHWLEPGQTPAP